MLRSFGRLIKRFPLVHATQVNSVQTLLFYSVQQWLVFSNVQVRCFDRGSQGQHVGHWQRRGARSRVQLPLDECCGLSAASVRQHRYLHLSVCHIVWLRQTHVDCVCSCVCLWATCFTQLPNFWLSCTRFLLALKLSSKLAASEMLSVDYFCLSELMNSNCPYLRAKG